MNTLPGNHVINPALQSPIHSGQSYQALQRAGSQGFEELLHPRDGAGDRTEHSREDQARSASEALVAATFIEPLLAQVRQDPFRSDLFHGGFAEDVFGAQMDSLIAEKITKGSNLSIVESIYQWTLTAGTKVNTHG